jgi:hypothetical protein
MHAVFVIPGIMGTELILPGAADAPAEKVWPPTPLETQFGYKRRDKLASSRAIPGNIITKVACFDFYEPLFESLRDLDFTLEGEQKRLVPFPYDWRRDLFDITKELAISIEGACAAGASRVSLVAHSMGGLICRLLLEAPTWRGQPWFRTIDQLMAIATPHLGAPLALGRILGVDSALGISGEDFAWLASQEKFPSAYQLLPAPGEEVCWNQTDPALASLDIYESATAGHLGLKNTLLHRAKAVHQVLAANEVPPDVRYFYFAGAGHRTATRINVFETATGVIDHERTTLTRTSDAGDGTVPMFSALPRLGQRHIVVNEHATAFKGDAFRKVFVRLLGGNEGPAFELAGPRLALSIEAPIVTAGAEIEILIHRTGDTDDALGAFDAIRGDLVVQRVRDGEATIAAEVLRVPLSYAGPPVSRLRVYLEPLLEPGHYQLSFVGMPDNAGPEAFAVCVRLPKAGNTASMPRH